MGLLSESPFLSQLKSTNQGRMNNRGFASAYPQPQATPWSDFGSNVWDAIKYDPDPNTTWLERVGGNLAGDMDAMISGFDAQGNRIPDTLRMLSLMSPGGTGLGGKSGLGILGATTGAGPKVGSAYASRLLPALEAMPQEKMTAAQAQGHLDKFPGGVGADEMQYSGLLDTLGEGGPVTKTGLLGQARANPLEITDVVKGSSGGNRLDELSDDALIDEAVTEWGVSRSDVASMDREDIISELTADLREQAGYRGRPEEDFLSPTKFHEGSMGSQETVLPGGDDYREMLLTLPTKKGKGLSKVDEDRLEYLTMKRVGQSLDGLMDHEQAEYFKLIKAREEGAAGGYTGGHYDEPNVLAHARYNTRPLTPAP